MLAALAALLMAQPLAGPAVPPASERPSLVHLDFNSKVRRPEVAPEQAALALLDLPAAARARAERILENRVAAIDRFVAENLFLLQELDTAGKAGDKLDQAVSLLRALDKLRPVLKNGPLRDQVAAALPASDAARFRAVVDEYWRAVTSESVREARAAGKKDARWQVALGERFRHLAEEIGRSYERQAAAGTLFVDYFMAELDLSPSQRETITALKLDMLQRGGMRPSEKDQQMLVVGALAYLNEAQRAKVIRRLTGK